MTNDDFDDFAAKTIKKLRAVYPTLRGILKLNG